MGIYNLKLIQYENGTAEIRTYSEVTGNLPVAMDEDLLIAKQLVAREHNKLKEHTVYNPFYEVEIGLYDFDEMEIARQRKLHSLSNSYSRTIQQIYAVSRSCRWEWFVTLTFSPAVVDRYDYKACMKKARKWFNNQQMRYAPDLQYLIVPEEHADGAWHIHGLIAQCGNMQITDSGHVHKSGHKQYNVSGWKFGISNASQVQDTSKISGYVTKYITKSLVARTEGKRRYYRSRNIPEPVETEFLLEGNEKEEFAKMLADSIGLTEQYVKEVGGYNAVKYQYFKSEV